MESSIKYMKSVQCVRSSPTYTKWLTSHTCDVKCHLGCGFCGFFMDFLIFSLVLFGLVHYSF